MPVTIRSRREVPGPHTAGVAMPGAFEITVAVDDSVAQGTLLVEHGFSLHVKAPGWQILLDSGQGYALEENVVSLGIDLRALDAVVLSHGHYDHSCGLDRLPLRERNIPVFLHPGAFAPRYRKCDTGPHKPIGMPGRVKDFLNTLPGQVRHTVAPAEVLPGAWVTGPIPRKTSYEDTGGPFFKDAACTEPDLIEDDQALWLESSEGIVVVLGCAHAGVINTLDYISGLTGQSRIHAVIGGMHLQSADETRLSETIQGLKSHQVNLVAPCHCTGARAMACLQDALPGVFVPCGCGSRFVFAL